MIKITKITQLRWKMSHQILFLNLLNRLWIWSFQSTVCWKLYYISPRLCKFWAFVNENDQYIIHMKYVLYFQWKVVILTNKLLGGKHLHIRFEAGSLFDIWKNFQYIMSRYKKFDLIFWYFQSVKKLIFKTPQIKSFNKKQHQNKWPNSILVELFYGTKNDFISRD